MNIKTFIKDTSIYGLVPAFNKFVAIFLIPIYTRCFSPGEFGILDFALKVFLMLGIFYHLQMYAGIGRYYYEVEVHKQKKFISSIIFTVFGIGILATFFIWVYSKKISIFLFEYSKYSDLVRLASIWTIFAALKPIFIVLMRFEKKPFHFLIISIIEVIFRISLTIILVIVLRIGIIGVIWGQLIGTIVGLIGYLIILNQKIILKYDLAWISKILKYSMPLFPALILHHLNNNLIRKVISYFIGNSELGIFALAFKISTFFVIFNFAIRMAWGPYLFEHYKKDKFQDHINKLYKLLIGLLSFTGIIFILFTKEIVQILSTPEYASAINYAGIFIIFNFIRILSNIIISGIKIAKKTSYISYASLIGFLVTYLSIYIFRNNINLLYISIAFICGEIIRYGLLFIWSEKLHKFNYPKLITVLSISLLFITTILSIYLVNNLTIRLLISLIILGISIIIIYKNKSLINKIFME